MPELFFRLSARDRAAALGVAVSRSGRSDIDVTYDIRAFVPELVEGGNRGDEPHMTSLRAVEELAGTLTAVI